MDLIPHTLIAGLCCLPICPLEAANYSEGISGDLADSRLTSTLFSLDPGGNILSATVTDLDDDFFTIQVPSNFVLSEITVLSYFHPNRGNVSFLGYQDGPTLLEDPADITQGEISYALLDDESRGDPLSSIFAVNFSAASTAFPLPAGDYAFWLNETDDLPGSLSLNFEVTPVPEPSSTFFLCLGLSAILKRTRTITS